jgi:hypothetical protein
MKSREEGGVVDAELNVYGTQALKVAGMIRWSSPRHDWTHSSSRYVDSTEQRRSSKCLL